MLYELLNKEPATEYNKPEALRNKHIYKIIELIAEKAKQSDKQYIIGGGAALAIYYDKIIRKHKDLDLYILKEDFDFWKSFIKSLNLDVNKNAWNDNYYAFFPNKKRNYKIIDINFEVPATVWDTKENKLTIITDRFFNGKFNGKEFSGSTIDHINYIEKYGIRILPPEIIKEQKIARLLTYARKSNKTRDDVDFRIFFDMIGVELVK